MSALATRSPQAEQDDELEMAIRICGGDVRAALRISLIANAFLEAEIDRLKGEVSSGFLRGRVYRSPQADDPEENAANANGPAEAERKH
jgi:hypothetical protein